MAKRRKKNAAEYLRCAWCGADWWQRAELDVIDGEIACLRGHGCARRPESDERQVARGGKVRVEYRLEGYWYTLPMLARIAGLSTWTVKTRLALGWQVSTAIDSKPQSSRQHAVGRSVRYIRVLAHSRETRRSPIVEYAALLGISAVMMRRRVQRYGLDGALAKGARRSAATFSTGRPPVRGVTVDSLAASVGLTRQGVHKAARKAGRTIDEEIAHRRAQLAAKATQEVAA